MNEAQKTTPYQMAIVNINEDELKKESPEWLAYYSLETQLGLFNIKGVWSNLVTLANYLTK